MIVSSITDNIEIFFSGLTANWKVVTNILIEMRERSNTLYSDIKYVCDQVCVPNPVNNTLTARIINVEHVIHTNILYRLQNIWSGVSSLWENLHKTPGGGICITEEENFEGSIGLVVNFNFTGNFAHRLSSQSFQDKKKQTFLKITLPHQFHRHRECIIWRRNLLHHLKKKIYSRTG